MVADSMFESSESEIARLLSITEAELPSVKDKIDEAPESVGAWLTFAAEITLASAEARTFVGVDPT